jgi:hypothetical protein
VEDSTRETGEATRNAAITASTLMDRDLRIQHAMAGDVGNGSTTEVCEAAARPRNTSEILCQNSLPFIARGELRVEKRREQCTFNRKQKS